MQQASLFSTQPHAPTADRLAAGERVAMRLKPLVRGAIHTDPLMTYAWSGDASSYRLIPAVVVFVNSEDEVREVFKAARAEGLPVTFRAAGTSLSGQAVTDGVLAVLGDGWRKLAIHPGAEKITLGPAVIVAEANRAHGQLPRLATRPRRSARRTFRRAVSCSCRNVRAGSSGCSGARKVGTGRP